MTEKRTKLNWVNCIITRYNPKPKFNLPETIYWETFSSVLDTTHAKRSGFVVSTSTFTRHIEDNFSLVKSMQATCGSDYPF